MVNSATVLIYPKTKAILTVVLSGTAVGELIIIVIFIALYAYNVRWKKSSARIAATLSHKYQVEQNIESALKLVPLAAANATCNLVSTLAVICSFNYAPIKNLPFFYFDITPFYYLALPIIIYWRRYVARQSRVQSIAASNCNEGSNHFEMLRAVFNGKSSR
ncbi:unnamed protein product [Anisakis simplex]|uniref:G protein-coupled receptor n=1 Tax=Anisakis simplex TaxID=6269 RepID=A0A0M3JWV2_ANISI|nr:unnamed protein product [Anisakis simplex]